MEAARVVRVVLLAAEVANRAAAATAASRSKAEPKAAGML